MLLDLIAKKIYPSKELDDYASPAEESAYNNYELKQTMKRYSYVDGGTVGFFIGLIVGAALCALGFWIF